MIVNNIKKKKEEKDNRRQHERERYKNLSGDKKQSYHNIFLDEYIKPFLSLKISP